MTATFITWRNSYALSLQSATCQMREKHFQSIFASNQKTKQKKHALILAFCVKSREKQRKQEKF